LCQSQLTPASATVAATIDATASAAAAVALGCSIQLQNSQNCAGGINVFNYYYKPSLAAADCWLPRPRPSAAADAPPPEGIFSKIDLPNAQSSLSEGSENC